MGVIADEGHELFTYDKCIATTQSYHKTFYDIV